MITSLRRATIYTARNHGVTDTDGADGRMPCDVSDLCVAVVSPKLAKRQLLRYLYHQSQSAVEESNAL
jgi:hypothetical protein